MIVAAQQGQDVKIVNITSRSLADLVVIGGRVLGIGTGAALEQVDTQAAETALAEAQVALSFPDSYIAAAACAHLMSGLLQHPRSRSTGNG